MQAIREFNEEMGRQARESLARVDAILEADANEYEARNGGE
jgi:hypothetical protein